MADIFSFPLRLAPGGGLAKVEQDSDAARAERLAMLILTRKGERALATGLGMLDPTLGDFDTSALAAQLARWAPDITLSGVNVEPVAADGLAVTVNFA